jgi:anti-anti-sigma regulatory factor
MLKISRAETDRGETRVLKIEGQVMGAWVEELRRACVEAADGNDRHRALILDLQGVSFLDANAVALCHELAARHVALTNCSPFIAEQLKGAVDVDR